MALLEGSRAIGRVTTLRLGTYYLVLGLIIAVVQWLLPTRTVATEMVPVDLPASLSALAGVRGSVELPSWSLAIVLSLLAVLMALPLSMVYVRTRTSDTYDRSLVHTVLALPLITTSIVVVVRDSLSLAFSLAGIVAAVRFRNNLKESRDAIYIFASIALGFAAGVEALPIALGLSVSFCLLELWQWKYGIGAEHDSTHQLLCGPPLDLEASLRAFDLPPSRIAETVARAKAGAPVVRTIVVPAAAEAEPPVPKVRVRLRIDSGVRGRDAVEQALGEIVKKFTEIDVQAGPPLLLTLLLRPRRKLQGGALHEALSRLPGVHLDLFEPQRIEMPPQLLRASLPVVPSAALAVPGAGSPPSPLAHGTPPADSRS